MRSNDDMVFEEMAVVVASFTQPLALLSWNSLSDAIQNMPPQNMAPWNIESLKLKDFETMAEGRSQ